MGHGRLQVAANSTYTDAVAVYNLTDYLPSYFEVQASISVIKPSSRQRMFVGFISPTTWPA